MMLTLKGRLDENLLEIINMQFMQSECQDSEEIFKPMKLHENMKIIVLATCFEYNIALTL